jgi:hypothetical protein
MALDNGEPPIGLSLALAQQGHPASVKVYQGNDIGSPDWARWRASLGTPVEAAGQLDWRTAAWPTELPNLLQGRHASRRNQVDWKRLLRPLALGAIALAGIQFTGLLLDWALLAREDAGIRREMRVLAERALPAHAAVVDPAWQVTERLRTLHAASGSPAADSFVGLLRQISQVWPAGTQVQTLAYESGAFNIALADADAAWLGQLKAAAATRGLNVGSEQDDKSKGVRLSVKPTALKDDRHGQ